jgi:hypothetical protein
MKDTFITRSLQIFAAMARSIFQQVGATEVAQPELMTLAGFNGTNRAYPAGSLIADAHGDLFGTTQLGGAYDLGQFLERATWSRSSGLCDRCAGEQDQGENG